MLKELLMNNRILAFIFTKDRPMQLSALLTSFNRNADGMFLPFIFYKVSNESYRSNYYKAMDEFKNTSIHAEEEYDEKDIVKVNGLSPNKISYLKLACDEANNHGNGLICIFTDDCIYYRKEDISPKEIQELFIEKPELLSFSFRLGKNTILQDYTTGRLQAPLSKYSTSKNNPKFIYWDWRDYWWANNYGYPFAMDGCCYRAYDVLYYTAKISVDNFRSWEGVLSGEANRENISQKYLSSPKKSCVVNIPANSMQWPPLHHSKKIEISSEKLNEMFSEGWRIDLDAMNFSKIIGSHQEIELKFKKVI